MIVALLAIFGLAFLLKESDGPWGVMNSFRNFLISRKYCGVFFYKLLECWFCTGCHCGWMVYLLYAEHYTWQFFTLWTLAGGVISLMLGGLFEYMHRE